MKRTGRRVPSTTTTDNRGTCSPGGANTAMQGTRCLIFLLFKIWILSINSLSLVGFFIDLGSSDNKLSNRWTILNTELLIFFDIVTFYIDRKIPENPGKLLITRWTKVACFQSVFLKNRLISRKCIRKIYCVLPIYLSDF